MFCRQCPKKLKEPAGLMRLAGMKKDLKAGFSVGKARAVLEQVWSTISTRGLSVLSKDHVAVLAGKAFSFLPGHGNDCIYHSKYMWEVGQRLLWHCKKRA